MAAPKRKYDGPPSTPLNHCANTRYPLTTATSNHVIFKEPHVQAAQEMAGRYEKISVKRLLNLLPRGPDGMPKPRYKALAAVARIKGETGMYDPFITAMRPYLATGWQFVNTSSYRDMSSGAAQFFGGSEIKPDMALYSENRKGKPPTDASEAELFGEFKVKVADDPFPGRHPAGLARDTRGQIALYINAIQATQQRTRVFFFFILSDHCRLFCHSRAGTQYTDLFKHTQTPHLHEFFWRLSHASPAARGHDTTFIPVTSRTNRSARAARRKLDLPQEAIIHQVTVGGRTLYVHRAFTRTHAYPIGRGTRCYAAYDPQRPSLVLLKDCWRYGKYDPEHSIYKRLHDAEVNHIPHVIAAGDVKGDFHTAKVNGYELIHYRLVLDIYGKPLTEAGSTYIFCQAISTALKAHEEACNKAHTLHRDISVGNIILFQGEGYLIDWERAKYLPDSGPRTKDRTGTWQFLSIRLLQDPEVVHEIRDDLESFIHVMAHSALRYAANRLTPEYRLHYLDRFDYTTNAPGANKLDLIKGGVSQLKLNTRPFFHLLNRLVESLVKLYTDTEDLVMQLEPNMNPAQVDAEVRKAKGLMLTHEWMKGVLDNALQDEGWPLIKDWDLNEVADPYVDDDRASKKLKAGHEYSQDLSTQRPSLSVTDFRQGDL